jgi:hypothetical protein
MSHSSHRRSDRVKALFAAVHESGSGALLGQGVAMSALSPQCGPKRTFTSQDHP